MSALAVYLEQEGIATVVISLIRTHSDKIAPARTLWVPFELGRPFGPPGDESFQTRVLAAALDLLSHDGPGPVSVDFELDDPNAESDPGWMAPLVDKAENIDDEIETLNASWHKSRQRYGATAVGLSGLPLRDAVQFLRRLDTETPMPLPDFAKNDGLSDVLRMRLAGDDLRAFYSEAACADGEPSSRQVWSWFWNETHAGRLLRLVRENSVASDDDLRRRVGSLLTVPRAYL